jgi:hypothetical protein
VYNRRYTNKLRRYGRFLCAVLAVQFNDHAASIAAAGHSRSVCRPASKARTDAHSGYHRRYPCRTRALLYGDPHRAQSANALRAKLALLSNRASLVEDLFAAR